MGGLPDVWGNNESPMGRDLLNHKTGDLVAVHAPAGIRTVRVLSIH